jgi:hypothetical protein
MFCPFRYPDPDAVMVQIGSENGDVRWLDPPTIHYCTLGNMQVARATPKQAARVFSFHRSIVLGGTNGNVVPRCCEKKFRVYGPSIGALRNPASHLPRYRVYAVDFSGFFVLRDVAVGMYYGTYFGMELRGTASRGVANEPCISIAEEEETHGHESPIWPGMKERLPLGLVLSKIPSVQTKGRKPVKGAVCLRTA